jgi:hypothetical protein
MRVDSASFETLPEPLGPWVMSVMLTGDGFENRAMPLVAKVGDLDVDLIVIASDGTMASGMLMDVPEPGARVSIGYLDSPELAETDVAFQPPQTA